MIKEHKGNGVSDTSQGPGWWQASDGKFYPPQGELPAGQSVPQAPAAPTAKKGGLGKKLGIGLGGLFGLAILISAIGGGATPEETALNAASSTETTAAPAEEAPPLEPAEAPAPTEAPKPAPTTPPPTAPPTTPKPTTTEAPKPQFSVSQTNAARKAASYLSHTAFSRQGLIEQLEYENFTREQAEYGVSKNGL